MCDKDLKTQFEAKRGLKRLTVEILIWIKLRSHKSILFNLNGKKNYD